jgi:streptomycin 6-kinase
MGVSIPERLVTACQTAPELRSWLNLLPDRIRTVEERWSLSLGTPIEGICSWVAPVVQRDGTHAILKFGVPHFEAEHEVQALRLLDGDPTVRLLDSDEDLGATLLERCEPGTALREIAELEQDAVVARLLHRFWRVPAAPHPFRPLAAMTAHWAKETLANSAQWRDAGLVREGIRLFEDLSQSSPQDVLLATDLHAGNVLKAQREPWLVIDPKPFIGDRAYDATQHLFNCERRLRAAPETTIRRFADLFELDYERVRLWMFARAAAEPRDVWDDDTVRLARVLA